MAKFKVVVEVTKRYEWDVEAESLESACAVVQKNPVNADAEMAGDITRIIFAEDAGATAAPAPTKPKSKKPRAKRRTKAEMAAVKAGEEQTQE